MQTEFLITKLVPGRRQEAGQGWGRQAGQYGALVPATMMTLTPLIWSHGGHRFAFTNSPCPGALQCPRNPCNGSHMWTVWSDPVAKRSCDRQPAQCEQLWLSPSLSLSVSLSLYLPAPEQWDSSAVYAVQTATWPEVHPRGTNTCTARRDSKFGGKEVD